MTIISNIISATNACVLRLQGMNAAKAGMIAYNINNDLIIDNLDTTGSIYILVLLVQHQKSI